MVKLYILNFSIVGCPGVILGGTHDRLSVPIGFRAIARKLSSLKYGRRGVLSIFLHAIVVSGDR